MDPLTLLDHKTVVARGAEFDTGLRVYRAECSCGWAGEWTDDQADADDAQQDHGEVAS